MATPESRYFSPSLCPHPILHSHGYNCNFSFKVTVPNTRSAKTRERSGQQGLLQKRADAVTFFNGLDRHGVECLVKPLHVLVRLGRERPSRLMTGPPP